MIKRIDFCRSFREEAGRVWCDMSEAVEFGLPRGEVTVTEDLLLRLARKHDGRGATVRAYKSEEEKQNGADWAIWFGRKNQPGYGLRLQAKSLYRKSRTYEAIKSTQCDNLIKHKDPDDLEPLYLFYNSDLLFKPSGSAHSKLQTLCKQSANLAKHPHDCHSWGITIAAPADIQSSGYSKKPGDFPMVPWHFLVCPDSWTRKRPFDTSLTARVQNGVRNLCGIDLSEDQRKQPAFKARFKAQSTPPGWVTLVLGPEIDETALDEAMFERNLQGVIVIEEMEIDPAPSAAIEGAADE